jgi:hypothetical protein
MRTRIILVVSGIATVLALLAGATLASTEKAKPAPSQTAGDGDGLFAGTQRTGRGQHKRTQRRGGS